MYTVQFPPSGGMVASLGDVFPLIGGDCFILEGHNATRNTHLIISEAESAYFSYITVGPAG